MLAEHEPDQKSSKSPKMECGGRGKPGVVLLMLMSRLGRPVRVVTPPASCLFWSVSWDRRGLTVIDFDIRDMDMDMDKGSNDRLVGSLTGHLHSGWYVLETDHIIRYFEQQLILNYMAA